MVTYSFLPLIILILLLLAIILYFLPVTLPIPDNAKSVIKTLHSYAILLAFSLTIRFWPPSGYEAALLEGGGGGGGMEINFGDSDTGAGDNFKSEVLDVKNVNQVTQTAASESPDEIISDDNENTTDAVVAKVTKPEKTKPTTKPNVKPVENPKPKVNNNANDALSSILGGKNKGGDGDDKSGGNKGKPNGNINSNGYYGDGGSGGGTGGGNGSGNGTGSGSGSGSGSGGGNGSGIGNGSGYSLGNRKALTKPQPNYTCNEEGRVVVKITVDRSGNVVIAEPGFKGTTNSAKCLLDEAKKAAMQTKWQPNADAPEKQVGSITYNYKLRD